MPCGTDVTLATPSNITRIREQLTRFEERNVPEIVHYQPGLGSRDDWYSFFAKGHVVDGIVENIREAYEFLCNVYAFSPYREGMADYN